MRAKAYRSDRHGPGLGRALAPAAAAALALVTACLSTPRPPEQNGDGGAIYGDGGGIYGDGGGIYGDGGVCNGMHYSQVASGSEFTCGLDTSGAVWCWGIGDDARLGRGANTTRDHGTPVPVKLPKNVQIAQISAGFSHVCAVDTNRQVWCWGDDGKGESGGQQDPSSPSLVGGLPDIAQVAAGNETTCAVSTAGEVWCWGDNDSKQAGQASGDDFNSPQRVLGLSGAVGVAVGDGVACARTSGGDAYCWGDADDGKLGTTTTDSYMPVPITGIGGGGKVEKLVANDYVCALTKVTHQVWCWGNDEYDQLGQKLDSSKWASPVQVNVSGAVDIAAGADHACAATASGELWCWGRNSDGDVGNSNIGKDGGPTKVVTGSVTQVSAGDRDSCFVTQGHGLDCLGSNRDGQIGVDRIVRAPFQVTLKGFTAKSVSAGGDHTCVLGSGNGAVGCFGADDHGQLGDGNNDSSSTPQRVENASGVLSGATAVATGTSFSCAWTQVTATTSTLWCWGKDDHKQLGGSGGDKNTAQPIASNVPAAATALAASTEHAVAARTAAGGTSWQLTLYNWGNDVDLAMSSQVVASSSVFVAAGDLFGCASSGTGALCWGDPSDGELGGPTGGSNSTAFPNSIQVAFSRLSTTVTALAAGGKHACAVTGSSNPLQCWGKNDVGQLGNGSTNNASAPQAASLSGAVDDVAAAGGNTCAVTAGKVYCWGGKPSGFSSTPQQITGLPAIRQVSTGAGYACAVDTNNQLWCWGSDRDGKLGSGRSLRFPSPTPPAGSCP